MNINGPVTYQVNPRYRGSSGTGQVPVAVLVTVPVSVLILVLVVGPCAWSVAVSGCLGCGSVVPSPCPAAWLVVAARRGGRRATGLLVPW